MNLLLFAGVGYALLKVRQVVVGSQNPPSTVDMTGTESDLSTKPISESTNNAILTIRNAYRPNIVRTNNNVPNKLVPQTAKGAPPNPDALIHTLNSGDRTRQPAAIARVGMGNSIYQKAGRIEKMNTIPAAPIGRQRFEPGYNPVDVLSLNNKEYEDRQSVAQHTTSSSILNAFVSMGILQEQKKIQQLYGLPQSRVNNFPGRYQVKVNEKYLPNTFPTQKDTIPAHVGQLITPRQLGKNKQFF